VRGSLRLSDAIGVDILRRAYSLQFSTMIIDMPGKSPPREDYHLASKQQRSHLDHRLLGIEPEGARARLNVSRATPSGAWSACCRFLLARPRFPLTGQLNTRRLLSM
jgi:hypothetical protein